MFLPSLFHSVTNDYKPFFLTGFGLNVDSFVVRSDYEDLAVMLQLSTEKLSGIKSTNLILYSEWRKENRP